MNKYQRKIAWILILVLSFVYNFPLARCTNLIASNEDAFKILNVASLNQRRITTTQQVLGFTLNGSSEYPIMVVEDEQISDAYHDLKKCLELPQNQASIEFSALPDSEVIIYALNSDPSGVGEIGLYEGENFDSLFETKAINGSDRIEHIDKIIPATRIKLTSPGRYQIRSLDGTTNIYYIEVIQGEKPVLNPPLKKGEVKRVEQDAIDRTRVNVYITNCRIAFPDKDRIWVRLYKITDHGRTQLIDSRKESEVNTEGNVKSELRLDGPGNYRVTVSRIRAGADKTVDIGTHEIDIYTDINILSIGQVDYKIQLVWEKLEEATSYTVEMIQETEEGKKKSISYDLKDNAYETKTLNIGETYRFVIRAFKGNRQIGYTATQIVHIACETNEEENEGNIDSNNNELDREDKEENDDSIESNDGDEHKEEADKNEDESNDSTDSNNSEADKEDKEENDDSIESNDGDEHKEESNKNEDENNGSTDSNNSETDREDKEENDHSIESNDEDENNGSIDSNNSEADKEDKEENDDSIESNGGDEHKEESNKNEDESNGSTDSNNSEADKEDKEDNDGSIESNDKDESKEETNKEDDENNSSTDSNNSETDREDKEDKEENDDSIEPNDGNEHKEESSKNEDESEDSPEFNSSQEDSDDNEGSKDSIEKNSDRENNQQIIQMNRITRIRGHKNIISNILDVNFSILYLKLNGDKLLFKDVPALHWAWDRVISIGTRVDRNTLQFLHKHINTN